MTAGLNLGAGLEGKGVICTGAAGGIGAAVARAFAKVGARVMAVDLDEAAVREVVAGLEGDGHVAAAFDLLEIDRHEELVRRARDELGSVRALAHMAAVLRRAATIDDVTEDDWDFQLDVNLKATFFLIRNAARAMQDAGDGGRIVAFSSQGWWTGGFGGSAVYSASKGGIVSMCRGLARTYGPSGITVNTIAPGQVETPMLLTGLDPKVLEDLRKATPLGRIAVPEEMAGTVVFLCSDHASFITGATVNLTGGLLMY